jgi:hypothetical protein
MSFSNYICWNRDAVNKTTVIDAASLPGWLFSGVHHSLPAYRRRLGHGDQGNPVTEDDTRNAFEGEVHPEGYLLIPVVGSAGTGKTHLVKWVYSQVKDEHDNWRSLYLPKNGTSLRGVISKLIDGETGGAIDRALEALEQAPAQHREDDALGTLLIDQLAFEALHGEDALSDLSNTELELRERVRTDLPTLLQDPITREAMTREGRVIPRLVDLAKNGRHEDDSHDDFDVQVSMEDLPLDIADAGRAAAPTQNILNAWRASPRKKEAAVALINDLLPRCIRNVFLSEGVDLVAILRELRCELHEQGKELALFIEDLTVLHGVEMAFLDAIVEPVQFTDGGPTMCPLRVLFAITEGHLDTMATIRERCEPAFHMNATHGDDGLNDQEAATFLARYLNGSRLDHGKKSLANACKKCDHQDSCHEAFGVSQEGHGLYPFTAKAATNFVRAHARENGRFDPRRTVLRLRDHLFGAYEEIPTNEYPSRTALDQFSETAPLMDPAVLESLRQSGHGERSYGVARFWSDSPPSLTSENLVALSIQLEILTAFGLPTSGLHGGVIVDPPPPPPPPPPNGNGEDPPPPATWKDQLDPGQERLLDQLPAWSQNGEPLSNELSRFVRQLVRDVVDQNVQLAITPHFHDFWFPSARQGDNIRDRLIHVEGSAGQPPPNPVVVVENNPETAFAVEALLRSSLPFDAEPTTTLWRIAAAEISSEWTKQFAAHFEDVKELEDLGEATAGLCLASLGTGQLGHPFEPEDLLTTLLSPLDPPDEDTGRSKKWESAMVRLLGRDMVKHKARRELIRNRLGESRGKGADVRAIDASRLQVLVHEFLNALANGRPTPVDAELERFREATDTEWRELARCIEQIGDVDLDTPWRTQTTTVLETLNAGWSEGLYSQQDDRRRLDEISQGASDEDHKSLARLDEVHQQEDFIARFCFAGSPDALIARSVAEFCRLSSKGFAEIDNALAGHTTGDGNSDATLQEILNALQELQALLDATDDDEDSP